MAEESRKAGGGAAAILREERKPSAAAPARKIIVKSADMKEETQREAIDCALAAFERLGVEKEIAEYIKKEFDKNHGPTWHCIVGRNFGDLTFLHWSIQYSLTKGAIISYVETYTFSWESLGQKLTLYGPFVVLLTELGLLTDLFNKCVR